MSDETRSSDVLTIPMIYGQVICLLLWDVD